MKTSEADFHFPVLGFTPDKDIWAFPDLNALTSCGPRTLKDDLQSGLELVDLDGRHWGVLSVKRIGRAQPVLVWLITRLLSPPQSRIEHELEPMPPMTVEEVKHRICVGMETNPGDYCDSNEPDDEFAERIKAVRAVKTMAEIHGLLGLDSFMAY